MSAAALGVICHFVRRQFVANPEPSQNPIFSPPNEHSKKSRKINGEPDLSTEARTRDVFTSEHSEAEGQPFANDILPPSHGLKLRFSQISIFRVCAEHLTSKRERGTKIM
jgi:hypothetical protein